ncbi:general stress protein [Dendrosporobacter sp. 1207_IL3150]|uniref:general stress protein n=1 Tax=Dendrosporobacter sp. 1207_IL3150 TaxID=3084054 RepID=UPI002FD9A24B
MNNQLNNQSQNNSSTDVVNSYTNSQSQQNSNSSSQAGKSSSQNTNTQKQKTVIGVFDSQVDAETAVSTLRTQGFTNEEINIVSKSNRQSNSTDKVSYDDDITDGALTGGTLGGIGGLLIGAGAMVVPGIGPLLAAGPISAAIGGALAGGLAGGLIDWGIPSEASQRYVRQVEQNKILAIVRTSEQKVDEAAKIFRRYGADNVESHQ